MNNIVYSAVFIVVLLVSCTDNSRSEYLSETERRNIELEEEVDSLEGLLLDLEEKKSSLVYSIKQIEEHAETTQFLLEEYRQTRSWHVLDDIESEIDDIISEIPDIDD